MGLPTRSVLAWERLYRFYKILLRRICTLLHAQKSTRKAPATFEAREAAGCGSLRLLRALDGTRILQAAATTRPERTRRQFQIVAAQSIQATRPVLE